MKVWLLAAALLCVTPAAMPLRAAESDGLLPNTNEVVPLVGVYRFASVPYFAGGPDAYTLRIWQGESGDAFKRDAKFGPLRFWIARTRDVDGVLLAKKGVAIDPLRDGGGRDIDFGVAKLDGDTLTLTIFGAEDDPLVYRASIATDAMVLTDEAQRRFVGERLKDDPRHRVETQ